MTTISMTKSSRKYIVICGDTDIICAGGSQIIRIKTNRVILVDGLTIQNWFHRLKVISIFNSFPKIILSAMPGLEHIEIQPLRHDETI